MGRKPGNQITMPGDIFEKYMNQKHMGAYYTSEDITEYISKNTIIPYLFDATRKQCPHAFTADGPIWSLLRANPDDYIYSVVAWGTRLPLPTEIAAGSQDMAQRAAWHIHAPADYGLPSETWGDVLARRKRYSELYTAITNGEITSINDLVSYNLDIRKFAHDVIIEGAEAELLLAFYKSIEQVTILDPTCGAGAFLCAALKILEPLYAACLERMEAIVGTRCIASADLSPGQTAARGADCRHGAQAADAIHLVPTGISTVVGETDLSCPANPQVNCQETLCASTDTINRSLRDILQATYVYPDRRYFILKSIISNNLYGLDIMEEAVEMCKLRLFLMLGTQASKAHDIEPLPAIDHHIRVGNALVGFTSMCIQTDDTISQMPLVLADAINRVPTQHEDKSADAINLVPTGVGTGGGETAAADTIHRSVQDVSCPPPGRAELDRELARAYGVSPDDTVAFQQWHKSHQPFHWCAEFTEVMHKGGFDVIIGNPPYVSTNTLDYTLYPPHYPTRFADLYAYALVRSLAHCSPQSRIGMIIPLSITFSNDFAILRKGVCATGSSWFSSYDNIPSPLFPAVSQRCTIWLSSRTSEPRIFVTPMYRWHSAYRWALTANIHYTATTHNTAHLESSGIPKLASAAQQHILTNIINAKDLPACYFLPQDRNGNIKLGFSQAARNFVSVFIEQPPCLDEKTREQVSSSQVGSIRLCTEEIAYAALALLVGETYFWYWLVRGDGFHITSQIISDFLCVLNALSEQDISRLTQLGRLLHEQRFVALVFKKNAGHYVGNYNYRKLPHITRRADLLLLAVLNIEATEALEILTYIQRVLSINQRVGEKAIPSEVKSKFNPQLLDESNAANLFREIDHVLTQHYGFSDKELDCIINDNIKRYITEGKGVSDAK